MIARALVSVPNALMDIDYFQMLVILAILSTIWLQAMSVLPALLPYLTVWIVVQAQPVHCVLMASRLRVIVLAAILDIIFIQEYVIYAQLV